MFIIEDHTVTVNRRASIQVTFLYFNFVSKCKSDILTYENAWFLFLSLCTTCMRQAKRTCKSMVVASNFLYMIK